MRRFVVIVVVLVALGLAYSWGVRDGARHRVRSAEATDAVARDAAGTATRDPSADTTGVAPATVPGVVDVPAEAVANGSSAATLPPRLDRWLLTGGMLNEQVERVIQGDDFDKAMAMARRDADAASLATSQAYRQVFEPALADQPGSPRVVDIACGQRVCLASVVSQASPLAGTDWARTLLDAASGTEMQMGAFDQFEKPLSGGRSQTRVVWAIGNSGFIVR